VGKVAINRLDVAINQDLAGVLLENTNNPEFVAYQLRSDEIQLAVASHKRGATIQGITRDNLKSLNLVLPPLEEQRKIAAVLGLVQRAMEQQQRLLALTAELKKALLRHLFTHGLRHEPQKQTEVGSIPQSWEVHKLGDIFDCLDGRRIPVKESDRKPGPYPYYGASGIVDHVNDYIFEGEYLLVAEDGENLESRKLPIAFIAKEKFWVNNHAHVLKNRCGSLKFFEQFISNMDIRDYLTGTTRPKLNKALMMTIRLPFPSGDEQVEIANILEAIDEKLSLHCRKHTALSTLFRTLLHELMTARIRVHHLELPEPIGTAA
jgi:type I restriction enzyme S subunit